MRIYKDNNCNRYFIQRLVSYGSVYRIKRVYFKTLKDAKGAGK